ncbi:unnamed protein product [Ambrosiozyma monospora]|uniref:Unnamed protein product n=1 Tax=Ambrosiozyma monospora TaxID=43982 RepID=A0A9W7DCR9_AMBMO|nr:unnamed protein product [Ambrosiozyma monospora]
MRDSVLPFPTHHDDLVLDVQYDFYGRHLATCSADQHIKIFDLVTNPDITNPTNNVIDPTNGLPSTAAVASAAAASGTPTNTPNSVWTLNDSIKAHDSTIVKLDFAHPEFGQLLLSASFDRTVKIWQEQTGEFAGSDHRWQKLATLSDAHGPLYDACFLPSFMGLKCCSIGSDGVLRIYDALEPANLSKWSLNDEINVTSVNLKSSFQSDFSISWCPSRFSTEKFVVSALDQAYIYYKNADTGKFVRGISLFDHNHEALIRSVSWAPSMGRSYHLIATACKDDFVRIFKLVEFFNKDKKSPEEGSLRFELHLLEKIDYKSEVWRVQWNATGTILSCCGDDGMVRLYKRNYANQFQCMSVISAKSSKQ